MILSIDPGTRESAFAVLDKDLRPIKFGKVLNEAMALLIPELMYDYKINNVAIEGVASYGMAVGKEIFETVFWSGRFWEISLRRVDLKDIKKIFRKEETLNLCGSARAKDGNVRQALIDRFGPVGVKKDQGWFYGVSKDVWAAIAVGVTYYDLYLKQNLRNNTTTVQ